MNNHPQNASLSVRRLCEREAPTAGEEASDRMGEVVGMFTIGGFEVGLAKWKGPVSSVVGTKPEREPDRLLLARVNIPFKHVLVRCQNFFAVVNHGGRAGFSEPAVENLPNPPQKRIR